MHQRTARQCRQDGYALGEAFDVAGRSVTAEVDSAAGDGLRCSALQVPSGQPLDSITTFWREFPSGGATTEPSSLFSKPSSAHVS